MLFSPAHVERLKAGATAPAYEALQTEFDAAFQARRTAAATLATARESGDAASLAIAKGTMRDGEATLQAVRNRARELVRSSSGKSVPTSIRHPRFSHSLPWG